MDEAILGLDAEDAREARARWSWQVQNGSVLFFTFQPQRGVLFGSPLAGSMVWCDRVRAKVASHLATIVNDLIRIDSIL